MSAVIKLACLAVYLLAVAGTLAAPGLAVTTALQYAAIILLAAHALETLVMFRLVARYPGPLVDSIALCLLFGMLHWLPLRQR